MPCRWKLSRRHSLCKRRSRCTRASSRSVRGSALAEFLEMPGNVHIVASASGATPTPKFWLYPHCLGKNRRPACSVPCRDSTNDCIQRVASGYCICNAIRLACIASTTFSKKTSHLTPSHHTYNITPILRARAARDKSYLTSPLIATRTPENNSIRFFFLYWKTSRTCCLWFRRRAESKTLAASSRVWLIEATA